MRTLEYTGYKNVQESQETLQKFVDRLLKTYPGIKTIDQIRSAIYRATVERKQRFRAGEGGTVTVFFGADIMSDEPLSNPAWQFMPAGWAQAILSQSTDLREAMRTVKGLSQTYFFTWHNNWLQEVTDEDYDLIMTSQYRKMFKDPEIHGLHVEVRAYDGIKMERISVNSLEESQRVLAERKQRNWKHGADLRTT